MSCSFVARETVASFSLKLSSTLLLWDSVIEQCGLCLHTTIMEGYIKLPLNMTMVAWLRR